MSSQLLLDPISPSYQHGRRAMTADSRRAKELVSEIIRDWPERAVFDAHGVLAAHPELREHKSAVLDLAYEEFCQRAERGCPVDPKSFAGKFPGLKESLRRLLDWHAVLSDNASALARLAHSKIPWPKAGARFLRFDLLEELGRGAFSRVFLAVEEDVGQRQVVVKVCEHGDLEAATLGKLQHPHIVPIYSVSADPDSGLTAICMPYIARATLQDVLDVVTSGPATPRNRETVFEAIRHVNQDSGNQDGGRSHTRAESDIRGSYINSVLRIASQIAEALTHAHRLGFLHCDIKPSNILVTSQGDCLLLDFNLAYRLGKDERLGGTLPYMAPEQLRRIANPQGESEPSAATDIFSLGVTLYQLLCGRHPFGEVPSRASQREAAAAFLQRQAAGAPPLRASNFYVDVSLSSLVDRCLRYDAAERPASAEFLAQALRRAVSRPQRWRRSARVHRRWLLTAGLATAAGAAFGAHQLATLEPYSVRQMAWGQELLRRGHWDGAVEAFTRVLRQQAESLNALLGRGVAHLGANRPREAYMDLDRVHQRSTDGFVSACCAHCLALLGIAEQVSTRFGEAVAFYEEARTRRFNTLAVLNNLGFCYLHARGMYHGLDRAEALLQQAVQSDDPPSVVLLNLAVVDRFRAIRNGASPSLTNIERALASEQTGPWTEVEAAYIYALCAARSPTEKQAKARMHQAITHCEEAVRLGVAPEVFMAQVISYAPALRDHPEIRALRLTRSPIMLDAATRLLPLLDGETLSLPSLGE